MPQAAEIVNADNSICSRDAFVAECRRFLGVRWQHQGRTNQGVDCVGLLVVPALRLGLIASSDDVANYEHAPQDGRLDCLLHKHARRLGDWRDVKEADILAVKYYDQPQHVMIVTRAWNYEWGCYVIHAYGNDDMPGTVIEHRLDDSWLDSHRARIHAAFSIKGVG